MTKVIIIQGGSLESYYEQTLDYLHQKYHSYSGTLHNLPGSSPSHHAEAETGCYERLAAEVAAEANIDGNIPLGKIVL